eukprot:TRINITY_DN4776_c0_g1_i1.p1 TRINITY_DN4776_c0_g1~~TRINITY_DN4776_c0_g1_i1.p1  ORF type:complete len:338 (-),score=57.93 TRINITY_DN4776_c0_g1_i1:179-1192(-)
MSLFWRRTLFVVFIIFVEGQNLGWKDDALLRPAVTNFYPVLGIMSQGDPSLQGETYIAASYVKWIESGGAQVVPIRCDTPESELEDLYKQLNGVVFPGGDSPMTPGHCYYNAAKFFIQKVLNNPQDYFVIHATCMGWEILANVIAGSDIADGWVVDVADERPVQLTEAWSTSRFFGSFQPKIIQNLQTLNTTYEYHHHGLMLDTLQQSQNLADFFTVLATSVTTKEPSGVEYVAAVEAKKFPIYATQFHPEKNMFEWHIPNKGIHSIEAVEVSQALGNFIVNEARRSTHGFASPTDLQNSLVYNYNATFTPNGYYVQMYKFPWKQQGGEITQNPVQL